MDLITIGTTAAIAVPSIAAAALYFDGRTLRKRLSVLNGRVSAAEGVHAKQRTRINQLENQAASDGNRLSQIRTENAVLTVERNSLRTKVDAAADSHRALSEQYRNALSGLAEAQTEIARLQPLADKALAAQTQRLRASQAAKAKRDAAKVANA